MTVVIWRVSRSSALILQAVPQSRKIPSLFQLFSTPLFSQHSFLIPDHLQEGVFSVKSVRQFTSKPWDYHLLHQCKTWSCLMLHTFAFILCLVTLKKTPSELLPKCPQKKCQGVAPDYCYFGFTVSDSTLLQLIIFLVRVKSSVHAAAGEKKILFLMYMFQWMTIFLTANSRSSEEASRLRKEEPVKGCNRHSFGPFLTLPKLWTLEFLNWKHDLGQERGMWSDTRGK